MNNLQYTIYCKNKNRLLKIIKFLSKHRLLFTYHYFFEKEGLYIRTEVRDWILERFLDKNKFQFNMDTQKHHEQKIVQENSEFFKYLFALLSHGLIFKSKEEKLKILERITHCSHNILGFDCTDEAYILTSFGLLRAFATEQEKIERKIKIIK